MNIAKSKGSTTFVPLAHAIALALGCVTAASACPPGATVCIDNSKPEGTYQNSPIGSAWESPGGVGAPYWSSSRYPENPREGYQSDDYCKLYYCGSRGPSGDGPAWARIVGGMVSPAAALQLDPARRPQEQYALRNPGYATRLGGGEPATRNSAAQDAYTALNDKTYDGRPDSPPDLAQTRPRLEECEAGSIIECQRQVLGEEIRIDGTPYRLYYRTDRLAGYTAGGYLRIPVVGKSVPSDLVEASVSVTIAGRTFEKSYAPAANTVHEFAWSGQNADGQYVNRAEVDVRIDYSVSGTADGQKERNRFERSNTTLLRTPIAKSFGYRVLMDVRDVRLEPAGAEFGGWTISVYHSFDAQYGVVSRGDGRREVVPHNYLRYEDSTAYVDVLSQDRTEIFRFDGRNGRHLKTFSNDRFHTLRREFEHDNAGRLTAIVEHVGTTQRRTNLSYGVAASGSKIDIEAPQGEGTRLTLSRSGSLNLLRSVQVASHAGAGSRNYAFSYDESSVDGWPNRKALLTGLLDERGGSHTFEYTCDGRLKSDIGAAGGGTRLTYAAIDGGFAITKEMSDKRPGFVVGDAAVTVSQTQALGDRGEVLARVGPDGSLTSEEVVNRSDPGQQGSVRTTLYGDGTRVELQDRYDRTTQTLTETSTVTLQSGRRLVSKAVTTGMQDRTLETSVPYDIDVVTIRTGADGKTSRTRTVSVPAKASGEVTAVIHTSPTGRLSEIGLNGRGLTVRRKDVFGQTSTVEYDAMDRVIQETSTAPSALTRLIDWNGAGKVERVAFSGVGDDGALARMSVSYLDYDVHGKPQKVLSGSAETSMTYDVSGNLTSVTPPYSRAYRFKYDVNGRMVKSVLPAVDPSSTAPGPAWSYSWYPGGSPAWTTLPNGDALHYQSKYGLIYGIDYIDACGLPAAGGCPSGYVSVYSRAGLPKMTFSNDGMRRLTELAAQDDAGGVNAPRLTIDYADGKISSVRFFPMGAATSDATIPEFRQDFAYDGAMRLASIRYNGIAHDIAYDAEGATTQIGALELAYDPATGVVKSADVGSIRTTFEEDSRRRGLLRSMQSSIAGKEVFTFSVKRDGLGRVTQEGESGRRIDGSAYSRVVDYVYSLEGRLLSADDSTTSESYTYDLNGKRLSTPRVSPGNIAYNGLGAVTRYGELFYAYDEGGRRTVRVDRTNPAAPRETTYRYSAMGHLVQAKLPTGDVVDYTLTGFGQRATKSVNGKLSKAWAYAPSGNAVVAEYDVASTMWSSFVRDEAGTLAYMERDGKRYRILTDMRGSPRAVIDDAGDVVEAMRFDAYGNRVSHEIAAGFAGIPFGFAGGLLDEETGLTHFGAREYDPESGTFTRIDPTGLDGGTHVYGYAAGDPINRIDVTGNEPQPPDRQIGMSYYDPEINMTTTPQSRGAFEPMSAPDIDVERRRYYTFAADHPYPFRQSIAATAACAATAGLINGPLLLRYALSPHAREIVFEGTVLYFGMYLEGKVSQSVSKRVQANDENRVRSGMAPMNHDEFGWEVWRQTPLP